MKANPYLSPTSKFSMPRTRANLRIGPHNITILAIIYGTLLGDGTLYNVNGNVRLRCEVSNKEYIEYIYLLLTNLGYVNPASEPTGRLRPNRNEIYYFYTYTYSSFILIHNEFYVNGIKVVPRSLDLYLTPLALAIVPPTPIPPEYCS